MKNEKAIEKYGEEIENNPQNAAAYYNRGSTYVKQGELIIACDNFYQSGILFLKQKNRTIALQCIELIKQTDPSSLLIKKLMDKISQE